MKPRLETQLTAVVIADQTMQPTEGVVAHFCNGSRRGCAAIMVELHAVNACAAVLNVLEIILDFFFNKFSLYLNVVVHNESDDHYGP